MHSGFAMLDSVSKNETLKISIHQPGYLPWLGFFKKIMHSDILVYLDDVKYVKRDWFNRNKIRTYKGSVWLSVPVQSKSGKNLNEIKIDNTKNWNSTHKKSIKYNYSRSTYLDKYWDFFDELYDRKFDYLIDLNIEVIRYLMRNLEINTTTIFSSELDISASKSDRILDICKTLGATNYLSGSGGRDYLNVNDFEKNNIVVEFQDFKHPVYRQCYEPFISNISAIDLLFNEGKNSTKILRNAKMSA